LIAPGAVCFYRMITLQGQLMNIMDLQQAAVLLKLPPETLRRKALSGEVPGRKVGKKWLFVEEHLGDFISRRRPAAPPVLQLINGGLSTPGKLSLCQSTKEKISGGYNLPWQTEREYKNLLGLK
jgi:excisionase family DNA binding protein